MVVMKTTTNTKATVTKCYCAECDRAGGSSPFCPRRMTDAEKRAAYGLDRATGKGREIHGRLPEPLVGR